MAVNFYLNSRGDKHGDFPIRVSIAIGGIRLLTSVGYSINPAKWDSFITVTTRHLVANADFTL